MSILLTHGYFLDEDEVEKKIMKPYSPLGLLYISAFLEQHNIEHEVYDSTFSNEADWLENLKAKTPKIIAFYTNLMTKVKILTLIKKVRSLEQFKETKILLGGPDVSFNWENYMAHGANFIIIGEGEETFLEFTIQALGNENYADVPGLVYTDKDGTFVKNLARIKIKNVDDLPPPNRSKIDMSQYLNTWKTHHGKSTLSISTQRGCPYTCQWCSTAVYGQSYRRRSPKLVADEVEELIKSYNPDALWFVDDVFTVSHKWINGLHEIFTARNLSIPFEIITRAERLNDTVLQQLKDMGCFRVWIGAESGSQRIIDKMDRKVDINHVSEMINKTQTYEMEAGTFIMVGYPTETIKDIKQTARYLRKALPSVLTITKTYPIVGTGLYEEIKDKITNQPEWSSSTDRNIEFELPYSKRFYKFAIHYIVNEYNGAMHENPIKKIKFFIKSKISYLLMKLT